MFAYFVPTDCGDWDDADRYNYDPRKWDEETLNYYSDAQAELFDGGFYFQCAECGDKNYHTECGDS